MEIENDSLDIEGNISKTQTTSPLLLVVHYRISVRLRNLKHRIKLKAGVMKKLGLFEVLMEEQQKSVSHPYHHAARQLYFS